MNFFPGPFAYPPPATETSAARRARSFGPVAYSVIGQEARPSTVVDVRSIPLERLTTMLVDAVVRNKPEPLQRAITVQLIARAKEATLDRIFASLQQLLTSRASQTILRRLRDAFTDVAVASAVGIEAVKQPRWVIWRGKSGTALQPVAVVDTSISPEGAVALLDLVSTSLRSQAASTGEVFAFGPEGRTPVTLAVAAPAPTTAGFYPRGY